MKHFGYWVFGKDMTNVKPKTLKDNGITDLFLNYYAFTAHGKNKVLEFIKECKTNKIDVHIWVQCFYDGEWHNPKTYDTTAKLKEIKNYAGMENVKGVHLDYLRYPGNAYKTDGGADAITAFVKKVRSQNPKTFLSCAVMPESENKKYYGQDISALGKIVDAILPMQYKGNYGAGTSWLTSTTKQFSKDATIWSGLQTYKSDDDTTQLTSKELLNDTKTCLTAGAKGAILFRYGICPTVNFTSLQDKTTTTTTKTTTVKTRPYTEIVTIAQNIKNNVEKKYKLGVNPSWTYYICKAIMKTKTDFPRIGTIKEAPNPRGNKLNLDIYKKDYFNMAKRLIKYVEANKVLPSYIKIVINEKTYKVKLEDYIYMFSRILVYYDKNDKFPKYANVNSKAFTKPTAKTTTKTTTTNIKKYGRSTQYGCDNRGQNNGYFCGPHMVQEIIRNLTGKIIPQSTLASIMGTTTSGTDHDGINTSFAWFNKTYGYNLEVTWKNFSEVGWDGIKKILESENQDAGLHELYRNTWGHYTNWDTIYNETIDVHNSLGDYCSGSCYCGYTENRSKSEALSYLNGISQKSVLIVTRKG